LPEAMRSFELNGQLATDIAIAHQHRRPHYWKVPGWH